MVQDFITSFDQFEKFALSEMAKLPEPNDHMNPFSPKFWSNFDSPNSRINNQAISSFYDTLPAGCLTDLFSTPRRSGRIANQTKINYKEYVPQNGKHFEKPKARKHKKRNNSNSKQRASRKNRRKEIRNLFKKPNEGNIVKSRPKSATKRFSKRNLNLAEMTKEFKISIPLIQISSAVTKASLKMFEDVLTMKNDHAHYATLKIQKDVNDSVEINSNIKNNSDDRIMKSIELERKNIIEVSQTSEHQTSVLTSNDIKNSSTEDKFGSVCEKSFSDIFKCLVSSSKKNEKLKQNNIEKNLEKMEESDTPLNSDDVKNDLIDNTPTNVQQNIVHEARQETEQPSDDFMEVIPEETNNEKTFEDFQMMDSPNENLQYSKDKPDTYSEQFCEENDLEAHKLEQRNVLEPSEEKERPLDLRMDLTQSILTKENEEASEDLKIPDDANAGECSDSNRNYTSKEKIDRSHQNFATKRQLYVEGPSKIQKQSKSTVRNDRKSRTTTKTFEECDNLSDSLTIMKISDNIQKATKREVISDRQFSENENEDPFSSVSMKVSNLQNSTVIDLRNDTPTLNVKFLEIAEVSNDDDNDVFTVAKNKPLRKNTIAGVFEKYQTKSSSSSSVMIEELNENNKDHPYAEKARSDEKIIEELKSLIDECPLEEEVEGCEKSFDVDLTHIISHSMEATTGDSVGNEIEIYEEESTDSEIEVIEEEFLIDAEKLNGNNKNREDFNKNSDDVEMLFPQGYHRVYQQEYIEVIHQYNNFFPSQSYQYHRYEYPIEENKFDYRPNSLSFLTQRYGEYQIPHQMHLNYNNNNYKMQVEESDNFEHENKLEITEYYEEDKEKDKQRVETNRTEPTNNTLEFQSRRDSDQNQIMLSLPPPIQCSSEQRYPQLQNVSLQSNQMPLQEQTQAENRSPINNNSELTYNQWPVALAQNCRQTTSSEQVVDQFYENTSSIQFLSHNTEEDQSQSQIIQRFHQVPAQLQNQIIQKQHQVMSTNNSGHQSCSQIAHFVKNNCHIHDVKFGKIKTLNGRMYRTGSLFITFGDHFKVQVIGDLIINNINDNIAFDGFFSPRNQF